jgi:hypothetical protein
MDLIEGHEERNFRSRAADVRCMVASNVEQAIATGNRE